MKMIQTPRMANMQNRYDRLSANPTLRPMQQRTMDRLGGKLGINPQTAVTKDGPNVSSTPIPLSRTPPPMATDSIPVGPRTGAMGGGTPPATTNFQPGMGGNIGGSAAGTPAGMNMRTMKKGGKVKQMVSGGMTSKASPASKRGDGIAQRGKTKGRMI